MNVHIDTRKAAAWWVRATFAVCFVSALCAGCRDFVLFGDPPTAVVSADDLEPVVGQTVNLDGSKSSDPNGFSLSYSWELTARPSGSTAAVSPSSTDQTKATTASLVPDKKGTYEVTLTVDNGGLTASASVTIETVNSTPLAAVSADTTTPEVGATVNLDASASSDRDGDPLSYTWGLTAAPEGSAATLSVNEADAAKATLSPDLAGSYEVTCTVSDGTAQDEATLTITAQAPSLH